MKPNSWGSEYRKFRIWGMNIRRSVLEKWPELQGKVPRMPVTAKTTPLK